MNRTRLLILVFAAVLGAAAGARPVGAHSGIQSYVYMSLFDDGVYGRVEYPIADLGAVLDIDFPEDDGDALAVASERRDEIVAYTAAHIELGDEAGNWPLEFAAALDYLPTPNGDYLLVPFTVDRDFDSLPRRWTVTFDGIIESNPERDALFLIEDDWQTGTFRNEGEHLLGFSVGQTTQSVELDSPSSLESMRALAGRGNDAVDTSPEQVLALVAVLAPIALLGARRRVGDGEADLAPGVRAALIASARRVGLVLAGQAVSVAAIGLIGSAPSLRLAGIAVALGVILAAGSGLVPVAMRSVHALAVGGLLGIGLGTTFVELQLHRSRPVRSLVAYDLGVAATVLLLAVLVLPTLLILGRLRIAPRLHLVAAAMFGLAGVIWLVEQTLEVQFPVLTLELRGLDLLTNPILMGVLTAIVAIAVLAVGRSQLRPSAGRRRAGSADTIDVGGVREGVDVG